ncbi:hypothetical protein ACFFX0_30695 [Citricoccus parietis]|uniref:Uncharacterized protein n=1 Tax=Citricoccus parietis TaxID=592307 RepID=A0ABV5G9J6_9MICC
MATVCHPRRARLPARCRWLLQRQTADGVEVLLTSTPSWRGRRGPPTISQFHLHRGPQPWSHRTV